MDKNIIKKYASSITKNDILTPDTYNKPIILTNSIAPLPKSGSSIINKNANKLTRSIGKTPLFIFLISLILLTKYLLVKIIRLSFINSEGWIPKPPIPIQLLEPFLIWPRPGIKTSISNIKHISNNLFEYFKYKW